MTFWTKESEMIRYLLALVCALLIPTTAMAQQLAFPGAEGYGRFASGGRGGVVYVVDSLADSGVGTLRECVEATGPRTCVFAVSGDIFLATTLRLRNPDITIAGQTAPGQGIQLRSAHGNNDTLLKIDGMNWIIRHLRIRPGPHTISTDTLDGISICDTWRPCSGILDHVSASFSVDELVQVAGQDLRGVTISNGLFTWPLNVASPSHPGPPAHGYLMNSSSASGFSLLGSLFAHGERRAPNFSSGNMGGPGGSGPTAGDIEFRNNVVYNCSKDCFQAFNHRGESWVNIAGNRWIAGADARPGVYPMNCYNYRDVTSPDCNEPNPQHFCLQDNAAEGNWPADIINGILAAEDAASVESTDCVNNPVLDPLENRGLTGAVLSDPEQAIIAQAGAIWWDRDSLDALAISGLQSRTGNIIDSPDEVGGYPVLATGNAPPDSDRDGMPDNWEISRGLNPNDAADGNADPDGNGYTNLEEYLHHMAGDATVGNKAPVAFAGHDRFVTVGDTVVLDGSGSSDPDGDSLTYKWTLSKPDGSTVTLASAVSPSFIADAAGDYMAQLVVNDGQIDSAPDTVTVVAQAAPSPPPPAVIGVGSAVTLNAQGVVTGGGVVDGQKWWFVEFADGSSGWVRESHLVLQ